MQALHPLFDALKREKHVTQQITDDEEIKRREYVGEGKGARRNSQDLPEEG